MGSALGSSSVQTPITSYTHQLRHTEAQDAISSFMFECGIPFKTPGTQHGMSCGMQCRRRGLGCAHSPPIGCNTYRTTALNKDESLW